MEFCARQGLGMMLTCVLLVSSSASSHYKIRRLGMTPEDYQYPYIEPEDSYYTSTSNHDLIEDDEEQLLDALARIDQMEQETRSKRESSRRRSSDSPNRRTKSTSASGRKSTKSSTPSRRREEGTELRKLDSNEQYRDQSDQERSGPRPQISSIPNQQRPTLPKNLSIEQPTKIRSDAGSQNSLQRTAGFDMAPNGQIRQMSQPAQTVATSKQQILTGPTTSPPVSPSKKSQGSTTTPWVRKYLNERLKDVLLPVPKEYMSDGFNLAQLPPIVERIGFQVMGNQAVDIAKRLVELSPRQSSYPIYRLALQLLLNEDETQEALILQHPLIPPHAIEQATEALYLMIHARFVASPRGLDALRRILLTSPVYGKCPNVECQGATLLPYGASNDYGVASSRVCQRYCPCCGNLWNWWDSKTDGSAWGPSLCHLLLLAHGTELYSTARQTTALTASTTSPQEASRSMLPPPELENPPTIMGFRIHPAATFGRPLNESW